jgi:hypothetical protein
MKQPEAYMLPPGAMVSRRLTWGGGRLAWDGHNWPLTGVTAHVVSAGWRHTLVITGPDFQISGRARGACQGTSGLPSGRTADLLAGGQVMSVLAVG